MWGRDEEYGGLPYYIDKNTNQKIALENHGSSAPANALDGRVRHDGIVVNGVDANGNKNEIIVSAADYYNNRYNICFYPFKIRYKNPKNVQHI